MVSELVPVAFDFFGNFLQAEVNLIEFVERFNEVFFRVVKVSNVIWERFKYFFYYFELFLFFASGKLGVPLVERDFIFYFEVFFREFVEYLQIRL